MNLKIIMLSERSQRKEEYIMYDSIYTKFCKMQTNQSREGREGLKDKRTFEGITNTAIIFIVVMISQGYTNIIVIRFHTSYMEFIVL